MRYINDCFERWLKWLKVLPSLLFVPPIPPSPHLPIPPSQREALYVSPLVLAGTFTASIKKLLALRQWSGWITPTSGVLLVGFGVISLLSRLVPIT